jgi:DNA-binding response OmpR family regulator
MNSIKILWVDDEIDLLKPHIIFLEKKDCNVTTCVSGAEALEIVEENNFDIIFLDENMPGLTGLETLSELKEKKSSYPCGNDYQE